MKNNIIVLIFLMLLLPFFGKAQITTDSIQAVFDIYKRLNDSDNGSKIIIDQDVRVVSFLKQHFNKGGSGKNLEGWRIRIFRDNSREGRSKSKWLAESFKQKYPGVPVHISYEVPYYYIAVGDYRTRDMAEKMKHELIKSYPGASLIKAQINFPPL